MVCLSNTHLVQLSSAILSVTNLIYTFSSACDVDTRVPSQLLMKAKLTVTDSVSFVNALRLAVRTVKLYYLSQRVHYQKFLLYTDRFAFSLKNKTQ